MQADVDFHGCGGSLQVEILGASHQTTHYCAHGLSRSLKLLPTSLHYHTLLSQTHRPLSLMDTTTVTPYLNMHSGTSVFAFIPPGMAPPSSGEASGWPLEFLGRIGHSLVVHRCFSPVCFHSVLCPCFKRERLTDCGGQMTIQVWVGANPSLGFPIQGRWWKEGKGCHSVSQRYKSQWQAGKTPELSSTDLRPCNVLVLLFHNFYSRVIVGYSSTLHGHSTDYMVTYMTSCVGRSQQC